MIVGRTKAFDYKGVLETIVEATSKYLTENGIKAQILGLSGGLDSTVCAAICKMVFEKTGIPLYGVSLPCSTNKSDEVSSASLAGKEFCNTFIENNIQDIFTVLERACGGISGVESIRVWSLSFNSI